MRALFLHGFTGDRLTWVGTTPALTGIEAITPDLPGHGNAVADLGAATLDALAEAMLPHLDAPAWIVGHSMGGGVALKLAAMRPEKVRGLVLLAPLGLGRMKDFPGLGAYSESQTETEVRGFLESLVANKGLIAPQFVDYAWTHLQKPGARAAYARIAPALPDMATAVQAVLPKVAAHETPVSVLWGDEDPVVAPDPALIGQVGDLMTFPKAGHILHIEAMAKVNAFLNARITGP